MKTVIRKFLKLCFLLLFLVSLAMFAVNQYRGFHAKKVYEQAEQLVEEGTTQYEKEAEEETTEAVRETEETSLADASPTVWQEALLEDEDPFIQKLQEKRLEPLRDLNPDVLGWIEIPDTQLSYPVMDGEDNEYYLNHTWDRQPSKAGSVLLEQCNHSDLGDFNTLLYGHRMINGSMFGSLKHYRDQEYYEAHPYVYLLDNLGAHRYEIFSAYTAPVNAVTFLYGFRTEEEMQEFLDYCVSQTEIDTGVVPTLDDKILTLVTCTGNGYEARWVVQARLKGVEDNPKRFFGSESE